MMIEERIIPSPNPEASALGKEFIEYCNVTNRIVAGYTDKSIVVWDALTGDKLKTFSKHSARLKGAKISPNGQKVVSFDANRIYVWDTVAGTSVTHVKSALAVAWYSDEVFYYSTNNKLLAIDITTGSTVKDKTVDEHDYIRWIDKHPTEDKILLGGTHSITVVDLDGELLTSIEGYRYIRELRWHPEGDKISFNDGYSFVVLDIDTKEVVTEVTHHAGISGDCVWSESGDKFMICGSSMGNRIYNLSGEGICGVYASQDSSTSFGAWAGNDSIICDPFFKTGNNGAIRIKNIDSTHRFDEHVGVTEDVLWSLNSTFALSFGEDKTVKVWDREGKVVASISESQGVIKDIAVANDSDRFAFLGEDNVINVWGDLGSSPTPRKFIQTDDVYTEMIWSGDNIVVTNGVELVVYDSKTGNMLKDFTDSEIVELKSVNKKDLVSYKNGDSLVTLNIDTEEKKEYEVFIEDFMYEFSLFGDSVVLFGNSEIEVREMTDFSLLFSSQDEVKRASWSSGGGFLTLVSDGGNLKIYDTENWSIYKSYSELDEEYDFVAMLDGGFLVAYGHPNEGLLLEGYSYEIGSGTEQNPFRIKNVEGFLGISRDRHSHYLLTDNLDIKGWEMFGPFHYGRDESGSVIGFEGTLDGNNCTLRGLQKNGMFFCVQNGGEIRNLILEDVNTDSPALFERSYAGTVKIENCHVQGSTKKGGFAVQVTDTEITFKDCTFTGTVTDGSGLMEGYWDWDDSPQRLVVENCHVKADIMNGCGIVGQTYAPNITIKDSSFEGNITNGSGVLGYGHENLLIENCHVKADIMSSKSEAGIMRQIHEVGGIIRDCTFEGSITSTSQSGIEVGGIVDYASCDIYNCHVKADIINPEGRSAGIGNRNYEGPAVNTIEGCTFEGTIEGRGAGVSSYHQGIIRNCKVNASIGIRNDGYGAIAGIVGETYNSEVIVEDCVFEGTLIGDGVGGLAKNLGGTMRRCLFIGEIINTQARYYPFSSGMVGSIYETGKLHESGFFGTIIDETEDPDTLLVGAVKEAVGEIKNVLVRGHIESPTGKVSGLFGEVSMLDNLENIYFEGTLEGAETFGAVQRIDGPPDQTTDSIYYSADAEDLYAIKKTLEELKEETTFPTWDFENIWVIDERVNDGFPMLRSLLKKGELDPPPARRPILIVGGGPDVGVYVVQVPK
jgi:WD40 repeat protein